MLFLAALYAAAAAMNVPSRSVMSAPSSSSCASYGEFEGSEDATLWKAGLVLQSSGLERAPGGRLPVSTQVLTLDPVPILC